MRATHPPLTPSLQQRSWIPSETASANRNREVVLPMLQLLPLWTLWLRFPLQRSWIPSDTASVNRNREVVLPMLLLPPPLRTLLLRIPLQRRWIRSIEANP